jgi:hypothetical protein
VVLTDGSEAAAEILQKQLIHRTIESSKDKSLGIDTDNVNTMFAPSGSLRITFHF